MRHLLSDPLSNVTRDALVQQYRNAPRSEFIVRDACVHLANGIGEIVVVNPTKNPIFFDDCSVVAVATSIATDGSADELREVSPPEVDPAQPIASLALTSEQDFC